MTPFAWTDARVREALGLARERGEEAIAYAGVSTDSRTVAREALFVALVGERFDGHDFVADAAAAGAAGAVVSRPPDGVEDLVLYRVDDTLEALGRLARYRRRHLSARVVGITGSSGKTTTKDLVRGALEPAYRVHATRGNLNNRIGLPRTVLDAPDETQILVLEMGTNEPGEIGILTGIAEPGYGVVTTVSETHLEELETLEGVLAEKLDLLRGLTEPGVGVVSDEPPVLAEAARGAAERVRVAGWSEAADPDLRP
ncbi:MAG: UDP-N-acetylmuramoyl-tripeptide--D-alanyl-D-alanine ligase, partial [Gemmatimonadetes bacterium]|nr:UDP-N-acetylmuramoyl-tripeptide--D-alanyl-D-alanine ligase [Gemmatimonadota bacterium]NIR78047.1 UDP-N-acetylmuramoyl-tripeptide--D-alanyl-D-alanine ligase [Gemmatimonadota bacterium]NIT86608.1 UDP-N-acetylmuramoyl-tripeptide--D-alanyl-D-alanine ligase [Gemmatimonadota bacterium]NIU30453.1 UDP-N-acetylmuramoyl-tripeptide--D-alanyl-D-alanine ligase [Gemmatimonadota bacterium]NIU35314.1 UDP-N-acetylmuramoyl-tripeptide--D-alanyl-D-alanine ligase [Gemmatimonadota bacterium]